MKYQFGDRSLRLLATVKPALRQVAQRAIELTTVDFGVVQGARTLLDQEKIAGEGRTCEELINMGVLPAIAAADARPDMQRVTWTLHSNHLVDPTDGLGSAIDVCPYIDGRLDWDEDGKKNAWPRIATAFAAASSELGIPVYWGGAWLGKKKDRPHFSLKNG